jgi:MFS family permease
MGLAEKIPRDRRLALVSVFLVANVFVWYFLAVRTIEEIIGNISASTFEMLLIWSMHFAALASSFLAGALLVHRIKRKSLFVSWILIGAISPLPLLILNFAPIPITLMTAILFGVSTGFGMPNCMEYFAKATKTENRGRYGGVIMFSSALGLFSFAMIAVGTFESVVILVIWRLVSLIVFLLTKISNENKEKVSPKPSFGYVIRQRSFILYIIPWIMFSLVNYLSTPVKNSVLDQSTVNVLAIIGNVILGLSALASGFVMDYFGRKQATIVGFALLGLSYSALGLFPTSLIGWYVYTVLGGITWGILIVVFVISIWGDISHNSPSDKYYAIGVLPFFISRYLETVLGSYISDSVLPTALFSFIAFFLFLAVLPLVYAPETLPEKTMKDRELKGYIEKAQKVKEKYS